MLSAIRRALDLVSQQRGEPFEMQDIPPEDPATYEMICRADTVGVFQIESRAQMSMLPRLQPREFYDLVIEVAIVRPGPVQGGMVHPYLRRRQKLEPVSFPSPEMETALARTLGVPIFQEQVMQVAMLAAGFSAGEADQLRRAMAAWKRKGGLEHYHQRIVDGMLERGYDREFAESIFAQIQGFGEYGFPESHSASFALLVYASAWLKCHEPAAFLCALLNSQPMGFYSPSQLVQDAKRHHVQVLPVDVAISSWDSTLEGGGSTAPVRLGLSLVRGMREESAARIEAARAVRSFSTVNDLANRAQLDRHDLQVLADANALASLSGNRREALWQAVAAVPDKDLLRATTRDEEALVLPAPSEGEEIVSDYRSTGLTLNRHPLALLRGRLDAKKIFAAARLATYPNNRLARACGIVTVRQRPGTANGVLFITLEDETGQVNVIVWPSLVEKFRKEALGAALLAVYGVWQREGEVRHLVANRLVDLSHLLGGLATASRNFH
jgi:error-prone DNA polymerase